MNKNETANSNKIQHLLLAGVKTSPRKNITIIFMTMEKLLLLMYSHCQKSVRYMSLHSFSLIHSISVGRVAQSV